VLRQGLIHPELLSGLASAGHGSTVLLADGHYPVTTGTHAAAQRVWLNLSPGLLTVTQVLESLVDVVAVESATVMQPPATEPEPAAFDDFRRLLPGAPLDGLDRFAFYDKAKEPDLAVVVATADVRTYANLLLTIGVAEPAVRNGENR
jgi:L-fucose mutarotase